MSGQSVTLATHVLPPPVYNDITGAVEAQQLYCWCFAEFQQLKLALQWLSQVTDDT